MGRKGTARVTGKQIMVMATSTGERGSAEGGMAALIKSLIKKILHGDSDTRENAAGMLASLAIQNHFEHTGTLFANGAVGPLVRLLITGSSKAQGHASTALHAIAHNQLDHQQAIVEAGAVVPLVKLLKTGASKVQEEVRAALLSSHDTSLAVFYAHAGHPTHPCPR
jgi:tetrahydromethanopterin S-methyltransferase subunit A